MFIHEINAKQVVEAAEVIVAVMGAVAAVAAAVVAIAGAVAEWRVIVVSRHPHNNLSKGGFSHVWNLVRCRAYHC